LSTGIGEERRMKQDEIVSEIKKLQKENEAIRDRLSRLLNENCTHYWSEWQKAPDWAIWQEERKCKVCGEYDYRRDDGLRKDA
jgi:hypothetical protein